MGMTYGLSLKCKIYGDRPHDPCSETSDDGSHSLCGCWCHRRPDLTEEEELTWQQVHDLYLLMMVGLILADIVCHPGEIAEIIQELFGWRESGSTTLGTGETGDSAE